MSSDPVNPIDAPLAILEQIVKDVDADLQKAFPGKNINIVTDGRRYMRLEVYSQYIQAIAAHAEVERNLYRPGEGVGW